MEGNRLTASWTLGPRQGLLNDRQGQQAVEMLSRAQHVLSLVGGE